MFNTVGIVGVGLIGGSLSLSFKKRKLAKNIVGFDTNIANLNKAIELNIIDEKADLDKIASADLVVVSTPVSTIAYYVIEILKKNKTLVLDVGSVKKPIIDQVLNVLDRNVPYVPMHPIAGTENFGPEAAIDGLFENAYCIITPFEGLSYDLIALSTKLVNSLGMKVKTMNPEVHDEVFGFVSHLPHVIAYSLVNLIFEKPKEYRFVGGGFRDYTRVAASSERMWSDIFFMNKKNVIKAINSYIKELQFISGLIERDDRDALVNYLSNARVMKKELDG